MNDAAAPRRRALRVRVGRNRRPGDRRRGAIAQVLKRAENQIAALRVRGQNHQIDSVAHALEHRAGLTRRQPLRHHVVGLVDENAPRRRNNHLLEHYRRRPACPAWADLSENRQSPWELACWPAYPRRTAGGDVWTPGGGVRRARRACSRPVHRVHEELRAEQS